MRVFAFVAMIVLVPAEAMAGTDIVAACYQTCAGQHAFQSRI
jgi:hypothetical protein